MKTWVVIFGTAILVCMIIVCQLCAWDSISWIFVVGLLIWLGLCLLYPKIRPITHMHANVSAWKMKAEGGFRGELTDRLEEPNQEFTKEIMSVLPTEWRLKVCTVIEQYAPTMIGHAVDVLIEGYIRDHLQENPAYWCDLSNSIITIVCGSPVDPMGRVHAETYITSVAQRMAADGQIIFTQTDAGEIVSLPAPPESCEPVT